MATRKARSSSRRAPAAFDVVREIGLALPDVEEGTSYGVPALKVRGQMFVCVPTHRSAEPQSVVVRLDFVDRDYLLAADPGAYYLKPHYVDYPCVLVRLERIRRGKLRELLEISRDFVAEKGKRR
jgi:hypothetical protein